MIQEGLSVEALVRKAEALPGPNVQERTHNIFVKAVVA